MTGTSEITPTPEQAIVRDCPAGQIIVAAGAGTGKTTTTMFRFGRLLDEGVELGQILVFTFTEKAAGELADSIRKTSGHRLNPDNPEAATMSEAWVGTFHSICARILRSFPIEAEVDPGFVILDEIDSKALKSRASAQAIQALLREDPEAESLVSRFRMNSLQGEIEDAYDELRARGIAHPSLPGIPDTAYPTALIEEFREAARSAGKTSGLNASPKDLCKRVVERLGTSLEGVTVEELNDLGTSSKNVAMDTYKDLLARVRAILVAYEDSDRTYRWVSRLIELFGKAYSDLKARESKLDYEDLQIKTVGLLTDSDHPQVGEYYKGRFREILVDEFQDTNGLQLNLIEALTGPETTVMTVGDEMQSIYRFRHANVELFRRRRAELGAAAEGADLTLRGNNRSDGRVLEFVNTVGRSLHASATSAGRTGSRHDFMDLEQSSVSGRGPGIPGSIRLLLTEIGDWGPLDLGEISPPVPREEGHDGKDEGSHEAEALAVAQTIRDLLDDQGNDYRQKDVAILLRAMTRADNYRKALEQVGLTPYVISGRGFWDSRVAIETRSLLRLVANPLDEEAALAALLSPACGVRTDVPLILRQGSLTSERLWSAAIRAARGESGEEQWFGKIAPDDLALLSSFVEEIEAIRATADLTPLDELIEMVAGRTGYDLAVLERDRDSFPDLKRIASIARTYESGHRRDLRGFLTWMDASEEVDSEASVAIEDERSDVVRIMTVHAAKGDEFEVVAIPDLGRNFKSDAESLLMLGPSSDPDVPTEFEVGIKVDGTPAYDWAEVAVASRFDNEDEELRLFHVAITRARAHLILSGCARNKRKTDDQITATTSIATRICDAAGVATRPDEEREWPSEPTAEGWAEVVQVEVNPADEKSAEWLRQAHEPLTPPETPTGGSPPLGRPDARSFPMVPLSFSALHEYAECPAMFFATRVLRLEEDGFGGPDEGPEGTPLSGRDEATAFGNAVHDLFEKISKRKWKSPDRGEVEQALEAENLDAGAPGLLERAEAMIEGFLSSDLGSTVRSNESKAEVPLLIRFGEVTMRGFIDLLTEAEIPIVIDFKTNSLDGTDPEDKMEDGYDLQRDLYALAVAEARHLDTVETAFVFLEEADRPVMKTYARSDLEAARERVEALVSGVLEGSYFGGGGGEAEPCGNCWACERLSAGTGSTAGAD
jgi:ATP-dependent exoDNAse (exonuclease V) beta subunit